MLATISRHVAYGLQMVRSLRPQATEKRKEAVLMSLKSCPSLKRHVWFDYPERSSAAADLKFGFKGFIGAFFQ